MTNHQRVGLHVSAAGGVQKAPDRALALGAECFQFFSRSPRGGGTPEISDETASEFKRKCKEYGLETYIHTPYYINFTSKNKRIYEGSASVVREELERGSKLGVKYVMTHMGSAKDWLPTPSSSLLPPKGIPSGSGVETDVDSSPDKGRRGGVSGEVLNYAVDGLKKIYKGNPKFSTKLLLEISAGSGAVLGGSFEELAYLLKGLGRKDVYVCLDTCHMFASGYDMRNKAGLDETMKQFRKHLGISRLKLVHANDSMNEFGSHKDRHEHIGKGLIGAKGFKEMLAHKDFQKTNFILETKHDKDIVNDINFLKKYRSVK